MRFPQPFAIEKGQRMFILYFLAASFIYFADSVMLYYFPIAVESSVNSNTVLGIIIGLASVVGLFLDIIIPQMFKGRSWKFLFMIGVVLSIAFPIITNLGIVFSSIFLFIIATMIWGIYYEFLAFSAQKFVITNIDKENYSRFWGTSTLILGFGSLAAPILGSFLVNSATGVSSSVFFAIQMCGLLCSIALVYKTPDLGHRKVVKSKVETTLNFLKEFKYWEVIGFRIWPVIFLVFVLAIVDSTFSTLGGVFGEQVFSKYGLGWVVLFIYYAPDILVSVFLSRFQIKEHKKRITLISSLIAGLALAPVFFLEGNELVVLFLILVASVMFSVAWIMSAAVFSDLQKRAEDSDIHVNSIVRANLSIGYFIGPIITGLLADFTNYYTTFGLLGFILVAVSLTLLIFTPKKIKLPQKLLNDLENN